MLGGLEGIIGLVCSALCCLLFVVILVGVAFALLRGKDDGDSGDGGEEAPSGALQDEGEDPATDMVEAARTPAPPPARPLGDMPLSEEEAAPTVRAGPRKAAPPPPRKDELPSTRSVRLDDPPGGLAAGPSATIIPPDDWIDDQEDDATLLMPKKPGS